MEVRDDGVGLSQEGYQSIHSGIGVSTTRERLLRLFGADFRFEFHRHNPGVAVVVSFPWRIDSSAASDQAAGHESSSSSRPWRVSNPDAPTTITGTMTGY